MRVAALQQMLRQQPVTGEDDGGGGGGWSDDFVPRPQSTHRVGWIFEDPHFTVDGFSSSDIKQGAGALDCWWLSAVATVCHRADLMDKLCVARDEACGVYGFVFYRDGEWVPAVVDDYLFLQAPDFEDTARASTTRARAATTSTGVTSSAGRTRCTSPPAPTRTRRGCR